MMAFSVLGLDETATPDEVRAAFRELAQVHHPDKGGDAAKFDAIRKAYAIALKEAERPKPCFMCLGAGRVTVVRGFTVTNVFCPNCSKKPETK